MRQRQQMDIQNPLGTSQQTLKQKESLSSKSEHFFHFLSFTMKEIFLQHKKQKKKHKKHLQNIDNEK